MTGFLMFVSVVGVLTGLLVVLSRDGFNAENVTVALSVALMVIIAEVVVMVGVTQ